jgi:hypothetical protein
MNGRRKVTHIFCRKCACCRKLSSGHVNYFKWMNGGLCLSRSVDVRFEFIEIHFGDSTDCNPEVEVTICELIVYHRICYFGVRYVLVVEDTISEVMIVEGK